MSTKLAGMASYACRLLLQVTQSPATSPGLNAAHRSRLVGEDDPEQLSSRSTVEAQSVDVGDADVDLDKVRMTQYSHFPG